MIVMKVSIEQWIESLRIKIHGGSQNWMQRLYKFHNVDEYWQKLRMLDKGKYRLRSKRSLHCWIVFQFLRSKKLPYLHKKDG